MIYSGLRGFVMLAALTLSPQHFLPGGPPAKDQEVFNQAKVLMFEQKWDGARQAFQRLIREFPQSSLVPQAYYHSAYCLQLQKKPEEAPAEIPERTCLCQSSPPDHRADRRGARRRG